MEIDYKVETNFKTFDLFLFVTTYKKKIKEKPMTKVKRYTSVLKKWTILILLALGAIGFIINSIDKNINIGGLLEIAIYFLAFMFIVYFYIYIQYKNVYHKDLYGMKGKIRVDDNGITDINNFHTVTFPFDQIEFVLIYNDLAFIIHKNSSVNMCLMNFDKKKLIEAMNKYNKKLLVIQQTTRKEG